LTDLFLKIEREILAVTGKIHYSNLKVASDSNDASSASTFAVDVAGFTSLKK
jgi:hypothetical protein